MSPGRIGGDPASGSNPWMNAGKAALLGAGLGTGYHFLKRKFVNTPEENQNQGWRSTVRDIGIPALGLGALNFGERSVFGGNPEDPNYNSGNYYAQAAHGHAPNIFGE